MKKSVLTLFVAAAFVFGGMLSGIGFEKPVTASNLKDLQSQKEELQDKRSDVNSKIDDTEEKIGEIQKEQADVKTEIRRLDVAIGDTENKIYDKQNQIKETEKEIKKLKEDIEVMTERINTRNELLKNRARSFQENGSSISYIEVLLGAKSFGDFIDRLGAIATIVEADQGIIEEHKKDKKLLEEAKIEVEEKKTGLEKMLTELESMKTSLSTQKAEKDQAMESLVAKEGELEDQKVSLQEERQIIAAQESAVKKAIQLEQKRIAEQKQNSGGSNNGGGGKTPAVSSGTFTQPAQGRLSSGFGPRYHPVYGNQGFHYGVDIAAGGTVPVVAAADGIVSYVAVSSSYGNWIQITHSIKGQIYTTVYAHLRSFNVGNGQTVSKGQVIGYMGNTGISTGQHLHFELHRGQWNGSKSNAINPVGIVPLP